VRTRPSEFFRKIERRPTVMEGHEHTPRNLLIRAVRGTPIGEAKFVEEYRRCAGWGR
jgi:hypothetical protein